MRLWLCNGSKEAQNSRGIGEEKVYWFSRFIFLSKHCTLKFFEFMMDFVFQIKGLTAKFA